MFMAFTKSLTSRSFKGNSGSAIAIVLVVFGGVGIFYFALSSFASSRSLQVHRVIHGVNLGDFTQRALLQTQEKFLEKRWTEDNGTFQEVVEIEKHKVNVFVYERHSSSPQWVNSNPDGEFFKLDSLHYLALACEEKACWISAAEEVFSPEPLAHRSDYLAWDIGWAKKPQDSIRTLSHLTTLSPADQRALNIEGCESFEEPICQKELLEKLRSQNKLAREREYFYGPAARNIRNHFPSLREELTEQQVVAVFKSIDNVRTTDRPGLYWSIATRDRIVRFSGPEDVKPQVLSIAPANNLPPEWNGVQKLLQWSANGKAYSFKSPDRFAEIFYHNQTNALEHYSGEKKWITKIYDNPASLVNLMYSKTGLQLFAAKVESSCLGSPPTNTEELVTLKEKFPAIKNRPKPEDCSMEVELAISYPLKEKVTLESPVIKIDGKDWISLASLFSLYAKLGGAPVGQFPDEYSKKAELASFFEVSGDRSKTHILFASY